MSYYLKIPHDRYQHTKKLVFDEVADSVFFQNYYLIEEDMDHIIDLKTIIKKIGNEADIETIIDACKRWTKHNTQEMAIVTCHIKSDEIVKNADVQKLLEFSIHHKISGDIILNGGIVFQYGKVSFHT